MKIREKRLISQITNERGKLAIDNTELQMITKCYEQFCATKLEYLKEMDNFLVSYSLPKINLCKKNI